MSKIAALGIAALCSTCLTIATAILFGGTPLSLANAVLAEEKKKEPVKINDIKIEEGCTKTKSACKQNKQIRALLRKAPPANKPTQASPGSRNNNASRK